MTVILGLLGSKVGDTFSLSAINFGTGWMGWDGMGWDDEHGLRAHEVGMGWPAVGMGWLRTG